MVISSYISQIQNYRKEGYSLREIADLLPVSYSTVRNYCKSVQMTERGRKRFQSIVPGTVKHVSVKKGLPDEKIRIIANLLFDGSVFRSKYHYGVMYVNSSDELTELMRNDIRKICGLEAHEEQINGKVGTYSKIRYFSRILYDDLLSHFPEFSTSSENCELPCWVMGGSKQIKKIFLQAFWENEGSISKDGTLSADLKNKKVIEQLSKLHIDFGLKHYISVYQKNGLAFKLILNRNKENYLNFFSLGFFDLSTVTKGYFIRKKKIDVLRQYLQERSWIEGNI